MQQNLSIRLSGVAAVAGGLLRAISPALADRPWAPMLWLAIDVLLLLGLIGLYARWAGATGRLGLALFVVCVAGVLTVRSQGAVPGAYAAGAAVWSLGLAALGVRLLFVKRTPRIGPALWIAAVPAGLAGPLGMTVAGVLFGIGYAAAGAKLARGEG